MTEQEVQVLLVAVLRARAAQRTQATMKPVMDFFADVAKAAIQIVSDLGEALTRWARAAAPIIISIGQAALRVYIARVLAQHDARAVRLRTPALPAPARVWLLSERCEG